MSARKTSSHHEVALEFLRMMAKGLFGDRIRGTRERRRVLAYAPELAELLVAVYKDGFVYGQQYGETVPRDVKVVHHLRYGHTDCCDISTRHDFPADWPPGHTWSTDWGDVTWNDAHPSSLQPAARARKGKHRHAR